MPIGWTKDWTYDVKEEIIATRSYRFSADEHETNCLFAELEQADSIGGAEVLSDHFVEVSKDQEGLWRWKIKRLAGSTGVTLYEAGFHTSAEAQLAGENFLKHYLNSIGED